MTIMPEFISTLNQKNVEGEGKIQLLTSSQQSACYGNSCSPTFNSEAALWMLKHVQKQFKNYEDLKLQ